MSDYLLVQGDVCRIPLADQSVDLVFGSPPYVDARLYLEQGRDLGIARGCAEWVAWMLGVTTEALRVSRGAVVWVAAGVTRDRNYWPACEGLMWEWWKRGGSAYRPCYWRRVGIPGSGGDQWFRSDVEYVMCFKRPGKIHWSNNLAKGNLPKYDIGGKLSHRTQEGRRINERKGPSPRTRFVASKENYYQNPKLANPGTLISTGAAGGGNIGHNLAHENEAPFPEALAEFFVRSLCPEGGIVLDPFSGSGTTCAVAVKHGRRGIGMDLRRSQCELGARRIPAGLRPVSKLDAPKPYEPSPGQLTLFGG